MKEIISFHQEFYPKLYKLHDLLVEILNVSEGDTPVRFLAMAFNSIVQDHELVDYYFSIWNKPILKTICLSGNPSTEAELVEENAQRLANLSKSTFIQVMSSLEYCLKEIVKEKFPADLKKIEKKSRGNIYLSSLIKLFEEKEIIDKSEKELWCGLITIRNKIVHNNSIAQENLTLSFPIQNLNFFRKGMNIPIKNITLIKDKMIQGDLMTFYNLISWIMQKYSGFTMKIYLEY